jgi:hypothetical protein
VSRILILLFFGVGSSDEDRPAKALEMVSLSSIIPLDNACFRVSQAWHPGLSSKGEFIANLFSSISTRMASSVLLRLGQSKPARAHPSLSESKRERLLM